MTYQGPVDFYADLFHIAHPPNWECRIHGVVIDGSKWEQALEFYGKTWCPKCVNDFLTSHRIYELAKVQA